MDLIDHKVYSCIIALSFLQVLVDLPIYLDRTLFFDPLICPLSYW